MKIKLEDAAKTQKKVYFRLTFDCVNKNTLTGEIGYIYSAVFCYSKAFDPPQISYYTYPYCYNETTKAWGMVGRPWFDFSKADYFTELSDLTSQNTI